MSFLAKTWIPCPEHIRSDAKNELIVNFARLKQELVEKKRPDRSKIRKWLGETKKLLEDLVLAHHLKEAIAWIYESFR